MKRLETIDRPGLKLFLGSHLHKIWTINNILHGFGKRYKILTSGREFDLRPSLHPRVVWLFLWNSLFSDCVTNIILSGARGLVFSSRVWDSRQTMMLVTGEMVITVINLMRIFIDFSLHISITFNSSHHYTTWRKINQNPSIHNNQTIGSSVPCTIPDSLHHVKRSTYPLTSVAFPNWHWTVLTAA